MKEICTEDGTCAVVGLYEDSEESSASAFVDESKQETDDFGSSAGSKSGKGSGDSGTNAITNGGSGEREYKIGSDGRKCYKDNLDDYGNECFFLE